MKKIVIAFILVLLACLAQAQMPIFRNMFSTNVPGAWVRGNPTFGNGSGFFIVNQSFTNVTGNAYFGGGTTLFADGILVEQPSIFYDDVIVSNFFRVQVDAAGGVDFMIHTNDYGTGTPLFIVNNGTVGINRDSQPSYSISANSYWAQTMTAENSLYSPAHWFGTVNGLPRLNLYGGGIVVLPQVGTTNWWTWADTNGTPKSVVNSNGWFGVNTLTPTAELEVNGQAKATNFLQTVPSWDDLRISLNTLSSPSAQPGKVTFAGGLSVYGFDAASEEQLDFSIQIPHGITTNNAYGLRLHLHWTGLATPAGANTNVVWGLEYSFANPGQIFPTTTITNRTTNGIITAYTHRIASILTVTNLKESGILVGRLFRDGGNTSDNYATDAAGLSLDGHYGRIKFGSDAEFGDY
jgi:hypothetical protein